QAADVAAERDVGKIEARGFHLRRILFVEIAHGEDLGMAKERIAVEVDLRVERQHPAVAGEDERIDLRERRVALVEGAVESLHQAPRLRKRSGGHTDALG